MHLAKLFQANFAQYADQATAEVQAAGPRTGPSPDRLPAPLSDTRAWPPSARGRARARARG